MFNSPGRGIPLGRSREIFSGCQRMSKVPNATEILPKIWTAWARRTNVTDRRQMDGRQPIANVNLSSRLLKTENWTVSKCGQVSRSVSWWSRTELATTTFNNHILWSYFPHLIYNYGISQNTSETFLISSNMLSAWPRKPTPRFKQRVASYRTTEVIAHQKAKRGCHGNVP